MSAGEVVVHLGTSEADAIVGEIVALAGDRSRPLRERAAWLSVGAQLLRQLRGAR